MDLEVYAPSLYSYFEKEPKKWLNEYLLGDAAAEDVMTDVTQMLHRSFRRRRSRRRQAGIGFFAA